MLKKNIMRIKNECTNASTFSLDNYYYIFICAIGRIVCVGFVVVQPPKSGTRMTTVQLLLTESFEEFFPQPRAAENKTQRAVARFKLTTTQLEMEGLTA